MVNENYQISEGAYVPRTMDNLSSKDKSVDTISSQGSIDDNQIFRNFRDRNKTWEQLQRPWSGKW